MTKTRAHKSLEMNECSCYLDIASAPVVEDRWANPQPCLSTDLHTVCMCSRHTELPRKPNIYADFEA